MGPQRLGRIDTIWCYPVKSMRGEPLNFADVGAGGIAGDRAYALVEVDGGEVASAKKPHWAPLLHCTAAFAEDVRPGEPAPGVRITFPDGQVLRSGVSDVDAPLSTLLGRSVALKRSDPAGPQGDPGAAWRAHRDGVKAGGSFRPEGTFFDYAPLHLLTIQTLEQLGSSGPLPVERFRPNLLIDAGDDAPRFPENGWVGREVAIGSEVRLWIADPCPRCVMTTQPQVDLPEDPGVLRAVAERNTVEVPVIGKPLPSAGVYGFVLRGGTFRPGDPVTIA
jgi:uncharacterized protein YcbX